MPTNPPRKTGASIISQITGLAFQFDTTTSEAYNGNASWTRFPVEGAGIDISDHVELQPRTISLQGVVTDTPLNQPNAEPNRAARAFETAMALRDAGQLVTVDTGLGAFANYGIEGVGAPRTPAGGQALRFTIDLVEVRITLSQVVAIPPELLKPKVINSGQGTGDLGTQTGTTTELGEEANEVTGLEVPEENDVTSSLLLDLGEEFNFLP